MDDSNNLASDRDTSDSLDELDFDDEFDEDFEEETEEELRAIESPHEGDFTTPRAEFSNDSDWTDSEQ